MKPATARRRRESTLSAWDPMRCGAVSIRLVVMFLSGVVLIWAASHLLHEAPPPPVSTETGAVTGDPSDAVPPKIKMPARIEVVIDRPHSLVEAEASLLSLSEAVLALDGVKAVSSALTSAGARYEIVIADADEAEPTLTALQSLVAELPEFPPATTPPPRDATWRSSPPQHVSLRPFVPERSRTLLPANPEHARDNVRPLAAVLQELPEITWTAVEGVTDPILTVRVDSSKLRQYALSRLGLQDVVQPALDAWKPADDVESFSHMMLDAKARVRLRDVAKVYLEGSHPVSFLPAFPGGVVHILRAPGSSWQDVESAVAKVLPQHGFGQGFEFVDETEFGQSVVATSCGLRGDAPDRFVLDHERWFEAQRSQFADGFPHLIRLRNIRSEHGLRPSATLHVRWPSELEGRADAFARQLERAAEARPDFESLRIEVRSEAGSWIRSWVRSEDETKRRREVVAYGDDLKALVDIESTIRAQLSKVEGLQFTHSLAPHLGDQELAILLVDKELARHGLAFGQVMTILYDHALRIDGAVESSVSVGPGEQSGPAHGAWIYMSATGQRATAKGLEQLLELSLEGKDGSVRVRDIARSFVTPGIWRIAHVGARRGIRISYDIAAGVDAARVDDSARRLLEGIDFAPSLAVHYGAVSDD